MTARGSTWTDIDALSRSGVNWDDVAILSATGSTGRMCIDGVIRITGRYAIRLVTGINWADFQSMSSGDQLGDIEFSRSAGVNWVGC